MAHAEDSKDQARDENHMDHFVPEKVTNKDIRWVIVVLGIIHVELTKFKIAV